MVYWADLKWSDYHTTVTEPEKFLDQQGDPNVAAWPYVYNVKQRMCKMQFVELANKINQIWGYYAW